MKSSHKEKFSAFNAVDYKLASPEIVIIIPCLAEPHIIDIVLSLMACDLPKSRVSVIILLNQSEHVSSISQKLNQISFDQLCNTHTIEHSILDSHLIYISDIPEKIAGVGTARKLAMDIAYHNLKKDSGLIVSLDADCTVSENYLKEIEKLLVHNLTTELFNFYFSHPILDPASDCHIIQYEAHLRYFINMQRWLNLPFAYQTIGSSFAVRRGAYPKVGGMNRRQAGEDFYFIHKFTKRLSVKDCPLLTVFPSSRESDRVPFGTGRAIKQMNLTNETYLSYNPKSFIDLKSFVDNIPYLYKNDPDLSRYAPHVRDFLITQKFTQTLSKIRSNVKSEESFYKSFFQYWDAFTLMKYLHYCRDQVYPNLPIEEILNSTNDVLQIEKQDSIYNYLKRLRKKDRETDFNPLQLLMQGRANLK